jgi:hypothetical protein
MKAKTKVTNDHLSLTKQAAQRQALRLQSHSEALSHATKILELMETADPDNAYGQDFWTAAKEYFTNPPFAEPPTEAQGGAVKAAEAYEAAYKDCAGNPDESRAAALSLAAAAAYNAATAAYFAAVARKEAAYAEAEAAYAAAYNAYSEAGAAYTAAKIAAGYALNNL